jgi:hypothetical protein
MSDAALARPERRTEPDGTPVDVFALPTDSESLEALLRELFANHWSEIVFGPVIQGAAFEIHVDAPPTHIGLLDGYLTIAFGQTHFHICIGETKGPRSRPTPPELARHRRTARCELQRRFGGTCVPMSWSLQLFNGGGEQQLCVLLPNPFLHPETERLMKEPDWSRLGLWNALRARWLGLEEEDPLDRLGRGAPPR